MSNIKKWTDRFDAEDYPHATLASEAVKQDCMLSEISDLRARIATLEAAQSGEAVQHTKVQFGLATYGPMLRAAIDLLAAVDERHEQPFPLKYSIPYGAVNALREAIEASPEHVVRSEILGFQTRRAIKAEDELRAWKESNPPTALLDAARLTQMEVVIARAIDRAWQLGQTYWQQADNEFSSQHKKANTTIANFKKVREESLAAVRDIVAGVTP